MLVRTGAGACVGLEGQVRVLLPAPPPPPRLYSNLRCRFVVPPSAFTLLFFCFGDTQRKRKRKRERERERRKRELSLMGSTFGPFHKDPLYQNLSPIRSHLAHFLKGLDPYDFLRYRMDNLKQPFAYIISVRRLRVRLFY